MPASAAPAPAAAERAFRRALGRFATGVTLITAPGGASLVVNAFMSVSLDPPLVAFCVGHSSLTWRRIEGHGHERVDHERRAARSGDEGHAGREPAERAVGDHVLVTCAVLEADYDDNRRPLVFFGGALGSFAA